MNVAAPTLIVTGLTKSFPGKPVLCGVDLRLQAAAITCLMGGNGSGKTTFFNLITGFLHPDSGSIYLGDTELVHRAPYEINRLGVTRTFQDLRLIGKISVLENLLLAFPRNPGERVSRALLPPRFHRNRTNSDRERAVKILEQFCLTDAAQNLASEISYGQQKLLTLACCVANGAHMLLLDEPVAGINPEFRKQMAGLLRDLKAAGKTIFMIEHNPEFNEEVSDKFLFLHEGKLLEFDNFQQLRQDPSVHEAYF